MQIANRESFAAAARRRGWTNPYVTDGLIAMWDGEWNAGGGVHDPNATTWSDLSGNGYNMILDMTLAEVKENGVLRKNVNTQGPIGVVSYNTGSPATLEICVTTSATAGSLAVLVYGPVSTVKTPCIIVKNVNTSGGQYEWSRDWNKSQRVVPVNATVVLSASANGSSTNGYVNANAMSGNASDTWGFPANTIAILGDPRKNSYGAKGYVAHNVRIYNRALTAAEIAANHTIDRERFGTP